MLLYIIITLLIIIVCIIICNITSNTKVSNTMELPKYISYLGNTTGKDEMQQCSMAYIQSAIEKGFMVYLNLKLQNNKLLSGMHEISVSFLEENQSNLLLYCEDKATYEYINAHISCMHEYQTYKDNILVVDIYLQTNHYSINKSICSSYILLYRQKYDAVKRFAIVISGRWKCQETNLFPQILKFLHDHPDVWIDVHVNINDDYAKLNEYLYGYLMDAPFIASFTCEKYEIPECYLSKAHAHANIQNTMSSFYTLGKAFDQLCQQNQKYDLVMKYRPDIVADQLPNLAEMQISAYTVYTPKIARYGFQGYNMNDQIAICDMKTMQIYCNVYEHVHKYIFQDNILLHPETLLHHHIKKHKVNIKLFSYIYSLDTKRK